MVEGFVPSGMSFKKKLKSAFAQAGIPAYKVAEKIGISNASFSARMQKARYSYAELEELACIVGCNLVVEFVPKGSKYSIEYVPEDKKEEQK